MGEVVELEVIEGADRIVLEIGSKPRPIPTSQATTALRALRVASGVRIEPVQLGALLEVDGEELFCKDLLPGQSARIAGLKLKLLASSGQSEGVVASVRTTGGRQAPSHGRHRPQSSAVGSSPASSSTRRAGAAGAARAGAAARATTPSSEVSHAAARPGGASRRALRARRSSSLVPAVAITAVLALVGFVVFQMVRNSTWPQTPSHYVELARTQFENNRAERALETLAFALKDADGMVRREAERLQAKIQRVLLEQSVALQVADASEQSRQLRTFAEGYLPAGGRPAARELLRISDAWLREYGEVCSWHPSGKPLLAEVEELRSRYSATAAPGTPETAEDAIFAARARLRFVWRDYVGAFARLDEYLAKHPDDERVSVARSEFLAAGEEWFEKQLRVLGSAIDRGNTYAVERDLGKLEARAALPQWLPRIQELRRRVDSMR
ncbi:MAG: hypothetical protein AB8H80_23620 [Planctomycetota bacterium]